MDFFTATLTLSLVVCIGGMLWRIRGWLRFSLDVNAPRMGARISGIIKGVSGVLFSRRILGITWRLPRDVLLQLHLLRQSPWRWLMHVSIFLGFVPLLLFHAMDGVISRPLLPGYEAPLDPYQFLRNLCGVFVILGLLLALIRRVRVTGPRGVNRGGDWLALALVAAIISSGFVLEAVKMLSPSVFDRMVEEYLPGAEDEDLTALKAFWSTQGLVFPDLPKPTQEAIEGWGRDQRVQLRLLPLPNVLGLCVQIPGAGALGNGEGAASHGR